MAENANSIDGLVKQAMTPPDTSWIEKDREKVKQIQAEKDAALAPEREAFTQRVGEDRALVDKTRKAIDPVDIEPWKQKPPEVDPIQKFGSIGSVFGILASAFTHQPWQNAMNAAAAAITASRANELEEYKTAYDAWKTNSKLMLDRHEIQMRDYQAAVQTMSTDVQAGTAMLRELGAKYGDQITSVLTEAGLDQKVFDVWKARADAARGLASIQLQIEGLGIQRMNALNNAEHQRNMEKLTQLRYDNEKDRRDAEIKERERHQKEMERIKVLEVEHKNAKNTIKVQQAVDNYDLAIGEIDGLIDMAGAGGVTGAAGYLKRGVESAEGAYHFFSGGSGETPAKDFQSKLDALKLQMPKLLTGASKSAKDERSRIENILRGTSTGDSKDATIHALEQVREMMIKRRDMMKGGKEVVDDEQAIDILGDAKAALAAGAPRQAVEDRLRSMGLDPSGL